jgi:hypothetical protein
MIKTRIGVAILSAVAMGSVALGGVALADSGGNGAGGTATNNCIPVGVNVLSGIGALAGQGVAGAGSCAATASGQGGNG